MRITERSALARALDAGSLLLMERPRRCPVGARAFNGYEAVP